MLNIIIGIALADAQGSLANTATSYLPRPFALILISTGMLFASFPEQNAFWAYWSSHLDDALRPLLPSGSEATRYMGSLGASFICIGIFFSAPSRRLLSHWLPNWLGSISFPIYLLHNSLIKTVLCSIVYANGKTETQYIDDHGGTMDRRISGGYVSFAMGLTAFFVCLLWLSWAWMKWVDPWFASGTKRAVEWMMGVGKEEKDGLLAGQSV
jgi:peptidoglycan/LPS O-acetylase OafA/YrhL